MEGKEGKEDQTPLAGGDFANMTVLSPALSLLAFSLQSATHVFLYKVVGWKCKYSAAESTEARCLNFLSGHPVLFGGNGTARLARSPETFYERLRTSSGDLLNS